MTVTKAHLIIKSCSIAMKCIGGLLSWGHQLVTRPWLQSAKLTRSLMRRRESGAKANMHPSRLPATTQSSGVTERAVTSALLLPSYLSTACMDMVTVYG